MRISDWSSDVCSSDLSWKDRLISQSPFRRPIEFSPPHGRCAPDCAQPQRRGNPPPPGSTRRRLPSPGSRPLQRRSFRLYPSPFAVPSDPRLSLDKRSEEHTSELQSLMRISYAVFCLKKKNKNTNAQNYITDILKH